MRKRRRMPTEQPRTAVPTAFSFLNAIIYFTVSENADGANGVSGTKRRPQFMATEYEPARSQTESAACDQPRVSAIYSLLFSKPAPLAQRLQAAKKHISLSMTSKEEVTGAWPVTSFNEWGRADERILIVTSHAVYRLKEIRTKSGTGFMTQSRAQFDGIIGVTVMETFGRFYDDEYLPGGFCLLLKERDTKRKPLLANPLQRHYQHVYKGTGPNPELMRDEIVSLISSALGVHKRLFPEQT